MKWIPNAASTWHRLWSMRLIILTTIYSTAAGAWVLIPPDWQPDLSHTVKVFLAGVGVALPALAAVSRLVDQPSIRFPPDNGEHS